MTYQTKWQTSSSTQVYQNPYITLREDKTIDPGGKPGIYTVIEKADAVFVVAQTNNNEIYLIKEYRYPINKVVSGLPAGAADKETDLLEAAKRELYEETGLKASTWDKLGEYYPAPALLTAKHHLFLASDLDESEIKNNGESNEEIIEIFKVNIDTLRELITNTQIEGPSLAALNIYLNKYY